MINFHEFVKIDKLFHYADNEIVTEFFVKKNENTKLAVERNKIKPTTGNNKPITKSKEKINLNSKVFKRNHILFLKYKKKYRLSIIYSVL